jgi:hypothetical protein
MEQQARLTSPVIRGLDEHEPVLDVRVTQAPVLEHIVPLGRGPLASIANTGYGLSVV